jgi:hypothetical protein
MKCKIKKIINNMKDKIIQKRQFIVQVKLSKTLHKNKKEHSFIIIHNLEVILYSMI